MFTDRLRKLREERKMTQKQAAEVFGISSTTYALYENGHREPNFDVLSRIADYYGVTCDYLLGRTIEPNAVSTYADIMRLLFPIMDTGLFYMSSTYVDDNWEVPCIVTRDRRIETFLSRWKLMLEKKEELSFDDELYSAWVEKQLRANMDPIVTQTKPPEPPINRDELPF